MKIRIFTILLGLSALLVASMAAFFSVYGIAKLFAGSLIPVAIMAGSLEFAKLITASFLYRYWKKVRWHLRTYFVAGILVLMIVTSAGIVGYLTSSYQGTTVGLERQQTKLDFLQSESDRLAQEKTRLQTDKEQLQDNLQQELKGLIITDTTRFLDVKRRSETVKRYQPTIDEKEKQIQDINKRILELQPQISDLKVAMIDTGVDVGPLVYLSRVFNTSMDNVVKLFIFLIVFVFDPLAVALVIATNMSLDEDKRVSEEKELRLKSKPIEQAFSDIHDKIEKIKIEKKEEISSEEPVFEEEFVPTQEDVEFLNKEEVSDKSPGVKVESVLIEPAPKVVIDENDIEEDIVVKMPARQVGTIIGEFVPTEKRVIEKKPVEKKKRFNQDILYGKKEPTVEIKKVEQKIEPKVEPKIEKGTIKKTDKEILETAFNLIRPPKEIEKKLEDRKKIIENEHTFYYGGNKYEKLAEDKLKWLEENFEIDDIINNDIPEPEGKMVVSPIIEIEGKEEPMTEEEMRLEWDRIVQEASDKAEQTYRTI